MQLIQQPDRWTCGPASLAMLLGISIEQVIKEIGHNGMEIMLPSKPEPICRRGFHHQEFMDVCERHGYALVPVDTVVQSTAGGEVFEIPLDAESRILYYMGKYPGLIVGCYAPGKYHMCAWDSKMVYDPQGRVYSFDEVGIEKIAIETFFAAIRIKSN